MRGAKGPPNRAALVILPLCPFAPLPLAFSFPIGDWQFWATTAIFLIAAAWLLRGLMPSRRRGRRRGQRVRLTIAGKPPEK